MKYCCVLQADEADCGTACLASIIKHYGRDFKRNRIREAIGTGRQGTTLLGLKRGAEALGFNARTVKASPIILNKLKEINLPAIIHWQGNHYVVLYGQKGNKYIIADPSVGVRYLSKKELTESWSDWVILSLDPDPVRFFAQSSEQIGGLGRFLKRVWFYRSIFIEAFLYSVMVGLISLTTPFLIQILTDDVLVRGDTKLLLTLAIAAIVMNIISSGLQLAEYNLIANFSQRLELGLVLEFGRQILQLPLSYYETRRSGGVANRLRDIQEINQLVAQVIFRLPSEFFIAVASLGLMCFYSWKLTVVAVIIATTMTGTTVSLLPMLRQKFRELLALEAGSQSVLVETFKGALTLKTMAAAPQLWEEFQGRFGSLANLALHTIRIGIINNTVSNLFSSIGNIALLCFGSVLVIRKELSIGQLLAFNSMNLNFLSLISTLIRFANEFTRVNVAVERFIEVIETKPEIESEISKPLAAIMDNADILCKDLNFYYTGRGKLLDNFSLIIPGGKITALIGKSGCGKTSLAKLIAGLYPLQSGNIRIGMYNLEDLSLDNLRQQVILVPQETHFWSRSIIENFRLSSPHVTFEQIVQACQVTGADDFISELPDKYQTVLGEFGANLSGGQRQRLAIARAIINDPPILILDESTSGIDPVTESLLLDDLLSNRQGKTTILISHRPRVIVRADWIVLLDQGKVKIQGYLEEVRTTVGDHLNFLIS